jgi:hypothetical protein
MKMLAKADVDTPARRYADTRARRDAGTPIRRHSLVTSSCKNGIPR